jgi:vacuolar iron transporter family protein
VRPHRESHRAARIGWLRAAVLGANDGLISTSSLVVGVASASPGMATVMLAGFAGLVGGALSMAAGEYVSVSSQSDSENADLARERVELRDYPEAEHRELVGIWLQRGLTPGTADKVARELAAHDALGAHARDELGITDLTRARPMVAAAASAAAFAVGALPPLLLVPVLPAAGVAWGVTGAAVLLLAVLGAVGARLGGAPPLRATVRVAFWGALAMVVSALAGHLFGAVT